MSLTQTHCKQASHLLQDTSPREIARSRSLFYRKIRDFFDGLDYVETETPILSPHLIPESSIEVFKTELTHPHKAADTLFLTPSPEVYMKILISEGIGDCYQLTKAFRNAEHYSPRHHAEFTILEWYAMNKDYNDNIQITKALLKALAPLCHPETRFLFENFEEVTITSLFQDYVSIDLEQCAEFSDFKQVASAAGFEHYAEQSTNWEELFNFIFVSHIENKLPQDKTLFVKEYPAQIPTTAKRNNHFYERWEFYMKGWEMANCYTEEARYDEMYALFKQEEAEKNKMMTPHVVDYDYLDIFKKDFPMCSGVALGVDRLLSIAMNAQSLDEVALFPFGNYLK